MNVLFPLKNKTGIVISNAFQSILDKFHLKPNEVWVEEGRKFYIRSMKAWLQGNDIKM